MLESKNKSLLYLLLFLGICLSFFQVGRFDFINFDDNVYLSENPYVNTGVSAQNMHWAFTRIHGGHWHPLSWMSHQMDVSLFGLKAGIHHWVNVFFHALSCLLLFRFLNRLTPQLPLNFLLVLLFALHPLRLESVVWVAERKDVLSVFLALLTLNAYLAYRQSRKKRDYFSSLLFFILGLLAKPSLMVLPLLLLAIDLWVLKAEKPLLKLLAEKIPFFLLSLISGSLALYTQNQDGALKSFSDYTLLQRLNNASVTYWIYWAKTFWPGTLSIFYPYRNYSPLWGGLAFLVFTVLSAMLISFRKRHPHLLLAWFWFFICLFPVLGLFQFGGQAYANRWTYLPHLGLVLAAALGLQNLARKKEIFLLLLFFVLVAQIRLQQELPYWKNSETLFSRALEENPNNFLAHTNLGVALVERGEVKQGEWHYEQALKNHPYYPEALSNLGALKARSGKLSEALPLFEKALSQDPQNKILRYNLGLAHYQLGKKEEAVALWLKLAEQEPRYAPTWKSLNFVKKNEKELLCRIASQQLSHHRAAELFACE